MTEPSSNEADLIRLGEALDTVLGDLRRTMPEAVQLHLHAVEGGGENDPLAHIADADGRYWSGGTVLAGGTDVWALETVANGVQDYLMEVEWTIWPMCESHQRGTQVRPHNAPANWTVDGNGFEGLPAWWCSADGWHELALVGSLR